MPRKLLPVDIFQSNPANVINLPEGFDFRGMAFSAINPDCIHLWFEGDPEYQTNPFRFTIAGNDDVIVPGSTFLGVVPVTDGAYRHIFMAPHKSTCKCNCGTPGGNCSHEWNGPSMTCSVCGIAMHEHPFMPRLRASPYPRLRPKSAHQKDDCIACNNPSTKEGVYGIATIRCCGNPDCVESAVELAKRLCGEPS